MNTYNAFIEYGQAYRALALYYNRFCCLRALDRADLTACLFDFPAALALETLADIFLGV